MNRRPRTATKAQPPKATHKGRTPNTSPTKIQKPAESSSTTRGERKDSVDPVFGIDLSSSMWDGFDLVEVVWIDAVATAIIEWSDIATICEEQVAQSRAVGYLIEDNKFRVVVVALVNENDAAHAMIIPRGMVHEVNVVRKSQ